ncbi:hypothetical protein [Streptomyces chryseus]|uniref:Uncharacterized protein n=1 Tax=Streptomyces chryseus TaxID=68186 RepID=A0ABQ3DFT7_9ACTN|nr:hypothetical protein [Streptomyces chryseus]GHA83092.1 hypothetical protein GCM10010346_01770 [Streptomyces chryseus]
MLAEPPPADADEETRLRYVAAAWLERARAVALLVAAGTTTYSRAARIMGTTPATVHHWATVGAALWERTGDAPEHLVDALASLPPLEPVRRRRPGSPDRSLTNPDRRGHVLPPRSGCGAPSLVTALGDPIPPAQDVAPGSSRPPPAAP